MELSKVKEIAEKTSNSGLMLGMFNVASELNENLSKQELISIIKELDWCITQNVDNETYNDITKDTLKELENSEIFE